jgi:hypothetical protein
MTRSTIKLVSMFTAAVLTMGLAGCSEWADAQPRRPASDSSYKSGQQKPQQWNASDSSSGTMSEPPKKSSGY